MKIDANFSSEQFDDVRIEGKGNPLTGNIAENQRVFDAFPEALRGKLENFVSRLNEVLKTVAYSENVTTALTAVEKQISDLSDEHNKDYEELENSIAQKIAELVGQAPETLDTLEEIANALGENKNTATEMLALIGKKVDKEDGKGLSKNDYTDAAKIKVDRLESVYVLKDGIDITVEDNVVTKLLSSDFSEYDAIAFPEGITEINLGVGDHGQPFIANKVIMPKSLKTIGRDCFGNYAKWDNEKNLIEDTIIVKVKEFVLNEGLETIESYAFADNIYLEKVNIPESVKVINRGAFQYCDSLKEIFIPTTVTKIGDANFTTTTFKAEDSTTICGYAGSEAERYAINENWVKEYANPFVNMGSDYSADIKENTKNIDLIDKYGTTDVYVLQEGIDFVSENGVITELLRWDFGEQTIAFPEGISSTGDISLPYDSNTNYFEFLTCKKLILPKSMTYFNIAPLKINDIDTGNVETIYLNANIDNRDVSQGLLPSDIYFNKHIKVVDIYYGSTNIHFNEVALSEVRISIRIDGSFYLGHRIGVDFRNLNDYNIDADDYTSDGYTPANIYFYGYAGSVAESYAKEHNIPFENIGSDYSAELGDIESAVKHILELDNRLLGGGVL